MSYPSISSLEENLLKDVADGITWAKDQGADVLSNSWGLHSLYRKLPLAYYTRVASSKREK